jgi:predicted methyltransferase
MSASADFKAEILEVLAVAREQAVDLGRPDPDAFAQRMLDAWLRGRVDRMILDSRAAEVPV